MLRLALLPGDGIGPEVMASARWVLREVASLETFALEFDEIPCGGQYYLRHGRDWPDNAETRCEAADAILLGAVGWPDPSGSGPVAMVDGRMAGWSAVIGNRRRLDLYANIRPVRLLEGVKPRICGRPAEVWAPGDVDLVIVRENTEGLYSGAGGTLQKAGTAEVATDVRILTRLGSRRICAIAFEHARRRSAAKVTAVAKHNLLEGCRFFVDVFEEVAADYPDVETELILVDAFAQSLVVEPDRYDVVVTTNLFGDVLTDLAAVLQGGMGLATGANLGDAHGMFEPIHGSAPGLAGTGKANPMAMILASAEALRWLGDRQDRPELSRAAQRVDAAVASVLRAGRPLTADLSAEGARTEDVTEAVLNRL